MTLSDWSHFYPLILALESEGLVTRTFRRLDPERQQIIIDAILDEAVAKGPTALNIKLVAARADVSVGALYTYFGSRDTMLDFAVELCTRFMVESLEGFRRYFVDVPLRDALVAYLSGGIEWSQTQVSLMRFFARAAYQSDPALQERLVRPVADVMRRMIDDILTGAVARGELRADIDRPAVTRLLHAIMIAVGDSQLLPYLNTYYQITGDDVDAARSQAALLDLLLRGLAPGDSS
jgi:TetR/AcrR family transcriptional regulator